MARNIYYTPGTVVTFKASGGDVTFTPTSLASGAGRISAQWDRGSGSQPFLYVWRAATKAAAALALGAQLNIYFATGDGSVVDGNLGTSDAAVSSSGKLNNLWYVGSISADTTSVESQYASGICEIRARYVSLIWFSSLGQALSGTAGDHWFSLTPVPDTVM